MLKRLALPTIAAGLLAALAPFAQAGDKQKYSWEGVERIVAVGDLHGDYDNYIETLRAAGLVNRRGKWTGGTTHLVQTGDIPDRGPDTREIMDHIDKLAGQAEKDGGRVHLLIGNHEAMNVYGDLRYVTEGEYEAFASRQSDALLDRLFELNLKALQEQDPEAYEALPENYRETWEASHPPGFVEHRQSWDPAWNPEGQYFERVQDLAVAVRINDTVFVHGGISDRYADLSLAELAEQAHASLAKFNPDDPGLIVDECGPLWYRGLSGTEPEVSPEVLSSILERLSAERIVVGHTPTPAVIWPRYDARVVQIDTGIAAHYGGYPAYLEITPDGLYAGYPQGKIALPASDEGRPEYFEAVKALQPENALLERLRDRLLPPPAAHEPPEPPAENPEAEPTAPADPCLVPAEAESAPAF